MFRMIDTSFYDILHYHGDDYLCTGSVRRVRTFYGSAFYEARYAVKPFRFLYQALFYVFELVSCLRKGEKIGISKNTALPLLNVNNIIPCGVSLETYKPGAGKTMHPSILFIGDLDSRKRGRFLVETFTRSILPQFPNATLTIVGPVPCRTPGVVYAGSLLEDELIAEYQKAWIYCSVSSYEGFGVPLVEAMACGAAVVATATGGALEILSHGRDGLLCNDGELAKTLLDIVTKQELRQRLVENGFQTVKKYDILGIARQYALVYQAHLNMLVGSKCL